MTLSGGQGDAGSGAPLVRSPLPCSSPLKTAGLARLWLQLLTLKVFLRIPFPNVMCRPILLNSLGGDAAVPVWPILNPTGEFQPLWNKGTFVPLFRGKPPLIHQVHSDLVEVCMHPRDQSQEGG